MPPGTAGPLLPAAQQVIDELEASENVSGEVDEKKRQETEEAHKRFPANSVQRLDTSTDDFHREEAHGKVHFECSFEASHNTYYQTQSRQTSGLGMLCTSWPNRRKLRE